jgi:hypothetical protein
MARGGDLKSKKGYFGTGLLVISPMALFHRSMAVFHRPTAVFHCPTVLFHRPTASFHPVQK